MHAYMYARCVWLSANGSSSQFIKYSGRWRLLQSMYYWQDLPVHYPASLTSDLRTSPTVSFDWL